NPTNGCIVAAMSSRTSWTIRPALLAILFGVSAVPSLAADTHIKYEVVAAFGEVSPGGNTPQAALIQASDGSFYGTTSNGGASNYGTVFKIDATGTLMTLHSFTSSDGANPQAGVLHAGDGSFYRLTVS